VPISKRIGYAVVGLGSIAETSVLPAFRHSKKCRLVALVSHDQKRAKQLGAKFGVGASDCYGYEDYDRCLNDPKVDTVFVASVNGAHAEQTVRAATAGKHVLCEKPLAATVEDCHRMVEACKRNSVYLMTAYRKYFEPGSVELKKLITTGKLGRLRHMFSTYTEVVDPKKAWQLKRDLAGGGSLMDIGIYCVNTMRWLAGTSPIEVTANTWTDDPIRFSEVEDSIAFRLVHPEGLVCQGTSSYSAKAASFVQVHGDKGWAALNPAFAFEEERRLFGKIQGRWFEKKFGVVDEFVLEIDHFADCIRRRHDPKPDGTEGLRDIATVQAIYQSARENRTVRVASIPG
jgi:predicted dehydrogenase